MLVISVLRSLVQRSSKLAITALRTTRESALPHLTALRMLRLRPAIRAFATKKLNLNADLGEGFGPWRLTDDAALMDIVSSANVACGGHAGDAATMVRACALAADRGVSIGAHPGYDDKPGFGRRVIPLSMDEVEELVACQVGALRSDAASLKRWGCIE